MSLVHRRGDNNLGYLLIVVLEAYGIGVLDGVVKFRHAAASLYQSVVVVRQRSRFLHKLGIDFVRFVLILHLQYDVIGRHGGQRPCAVTDVDEFLCRDAHYTFVETVPMSAGKRNPRVFDGEHITITRWDDGSLHPNFEPLKMGAGFSVDSYAISVCNELRLALKGLVEK